MAQLIASGNLPGPVNVKIKDGSKINMDVTQGLTYKITSPPVDIPVGTNTAGRT